MGGQQDGAVATQLVHQLAEAHSLLGVQADGGLVDDDHLRFVNQRLGNAEATHHATGELLHLAVGDAVETDHLQRFSDPPTPLLAVGHARQLRQGVEDLLGPMMPPGAELLRQIADQLAHLATFPCHVVAVHRGPALGRHEQRTDDAHQRAFARAVGSQQPEKSRTERQIDVLEGRVTALVGVTETAGLDDGIATGGQHRFGVGHRRIPWLVFKSASYAITSRRQGPNVRSKLSKTGNGATKQQSMTYYVSRQRTDVPLAVARRRGNRSQTRSMRMAMPNARTPATRRTP